LYPLRLFEEKVVIAVSPGDARKAELHVTYAQKRLSELDSVVLPHDQTLDTVARNFDMHMDKAYDFLEEQESAEEPTVYAKVALGFASLVQIGEVSILEPIAMTQGVGTNAARPETLRTAMVESELDDAAFDGAAEALPIELAPTMAEFSHSKEETHRAMKSDLAPTPLSKIRHIQIKNEERAIAALRIADKLLSGATQEERRIKHQIATELDEAGVSGLDTEVTREEMSPDTVRETNNRENELEMTRPKVPPAATTSWETSVIPRGETNMGEGEIDGEGEVTGGSAPSETGTINADMPNENGSEQDGEKEGEEVSVESTTTSVQRVKATPVSTTSSTEPEQTESSESVETSQTSNSSNKPASYVVR
jgi:hypothetical protein